MRDIDLELKAGRTLGVVGTNGSGKSTMLKLMAGVSNPTNGIVRVEGNIVGLLELGAGFHPDLTGYQNIFLQCNLLGMRRAEIEERLPQIVEFSGLQHCLDWPVKRYSSGMYARLGFSVAVHADAQIILVDEILAVGDADFQRRGIARMQQIKQSGQAILVIVTHDVDLARGFCDEVIWLDEGRIAGRGDPVEVCQQYWDSVLPKMREASGLVTDKHLVEEALAAIQQKRTVRMTSVRFEDAAGQAIESVEAHAPVQVAIDVESDEVIEDAHLSLLLVSQEEVITAEIDSRNLPGRISIPRGESTIRVMLDPQLMLDGVYFATVILFRDAERSTALDARFRQGALTVRSSPPQPIWHAVTHPHEWVFEGPKAHEE